MGGSGQEPVVERVDPFAQAPVGSGYDPNAYTITTPAVRRALAAVSEYLSAPNGSGAGKILAVTGEYGTGKTHLARHVIHRVETAGDARVRTLYLVARDRERTFLGLYKHLAEILVKQSGSEIFDLVRRIYAGVVAGLLRESPIGVRLADDLDRGLLDPVRVVADRGLEESELLDRLQVQLQNATSDRNFSLALTLLVRPDFESSAREWLLGYPPDSLLRERGLTWAIDTEGAALEAMGVLALLYHRAGVPLVLVIDEIEYILQRPDPPGDEVLAAFQEFLEKITAAGAFLMLVGLPESIDDLPPPVRGRIGEPIRMTRFSRDDVIAFMAGSNPGLPQPEALRPFTPSTIEYLVELVGGVARTIIKIGKRLTRKVRGTGATVTEAMVREALREEYDIDVPSKVHWEIEVILGAGAWPYTLNHQVGRPSVTVDYWVTVGEGAYCAVLITESVLDEREADALLRRIETIREEPYAVQVVPVIVGFLPQGRAEQIATAIEGRPVTFEARSFGDEFDSAFRTAVERVGGPDSAAEPGQPVSSAVVRRLARQQSNTFRLLGQTSTSLDGFRVSSDRQFATIVRMLQDLATTQPAATAAPQPPAVLPDGVEELFGRADAALYPVAQVQELFDAALRPHVPPPDLPIRLDRLRSQAVQSAAGAGFLLHQWLNAFRRSVASWYTTAVQSERESYDWESLRAVCGRFDAVYEEMPTFDVDELSGLTGRAPAPPARGPAVADAVYRLGSKVQARMRQSLGVTG
jgi:Cdc6-like AAA superfamily ATPase